METVTSSIDTSHEDIVHDACLDFYGSRLATCSSDKTIKIFDTSRNDESAKCLAIDYLRGHRGPVWQLSWSHPIYDSLLASASQDRTVRLWREDLSRSSWAVVYEFKGHHASVNTVQFAPYQHGLMLAAGSSDGCISILTKDHTKERSDWQSKMLTGAHEMGVNSISWGNPSRVQFVSGGSDGLVKIWQRDDSEWTVVCKIAGHRDCVRDVAWSPNVCNNFIATCGQDMHVVIWQQAVGSAEFTAAAAKERFDAPAASQEWTELERIKLDHVAWTVSWCMTGNTLVIAGQDNKVRFFKRTLSGHFMEISGSNKGGTTRQQPIQQMESPNTKMQIELEQSTAFVGYNSGQTSM